MYYVTDGAKSNKWGIYIVMNRINEIVAENISRGEARRKAREERKQGRRGFRIEKIKALTGKAYAVASKRKWLVYLIGLGIAVYFILTSGGGAGFTGLIESVKGLF